MDKIHLQSVQQLMMIHDFATRYWQLKSGKWTRRKQKGLLTHCCSTKNEGLWPCKRFGIQRIGKQMLPFLHCMLLCQCTLLKDVGLKSTSPSKTKVTSMYFSGTQVLQQVGNLPNCSYLKIPPTPKHLCLVNFSSPNTSAINRPSVAKTTAHRVKSLGIGASWDVHDPQTSVHLHRIWGGGLMDFWNCNPEKALWQPCGLHVWYYII